MITRETYENGLMPALPVGYTRWEYRGTGWDSGGIKTWICFGLTGSGMSPPFEPPARNLRAAFGYAVGASHLFYWEAVNTPNKPEEAITTVPNYEL